MERAVQLGVFRSVLSLSVSVGLGCGSRLGFGARFDRCAEDELTACGFDLFDGGTRGAVNVNGERFGNFAIAEQFDCVVVIADESCFKQGFAVDGVALNFLELRDVDGLEVLAEIEVVETTARELAVEGHLTALETDADAAAATSFLSLVAIAGGFTVATVVPSPAVSRGMGLALARWTFIAFHAAFMAWASAA